MAINIGPLARGLARRELAGVAVVVEPLDEAVDPSEAKRFANGVLVGDRLHTGVIFVEHEPDARARRMALREPRPPLAPVPNLEHGDFTGGHIRLQRRYLSISLPAPTVNFRLHWWSGPLACYVGIHADIFNSGHRYLKNVATNGEMAGQRPTPPGLLRLVAK